MTLVEKQYKEPFLNYIRYDYCENPDEYKLIEIIISDQPSKMYDAILRHKINKNIKKISFGRTHGVIYKDTTKIKFYKTHGTLKKDSQKIFRIMNKREIKKKFSEKYFANKYLYSD